jgi:methylated-DNA-[protein]-cysteine S-methyltransferase
MSSTAIATELNTGLLSRRVELAGIGSVRLLACEDRLCGIELPASGAYEWAALVVDDAGSSDILDETEAWLDRLLSGGDPGRLPRIELRVSDYRSRVLSKVAQIGYGKSVSYGELAVQIGSSPRAVGGAVGANPIPLVVPCHRVLGHNRGLGGFSGGLGVKRHLLGLEGITWRE